MKRLFPCVLADARRGAVFSPYALTLCAAVVATLIFGFFMVPFAQQVGFDEGYEAAAAERLIDGHWRPYVDSVAHRGPFLYWILAVFQLLTGRFEWVGTRALGLIGCLVTVFATTALGAIMRRPLPGAIGGLVYVYAIAVLYDVGGGIGVHSESVATPILAVACCCAAYASQRLAQSRRRKLWLALAGVLLGVATFTKQTFALAVVPLMIFLVSNEWSKIESASGRWRQVALEVLVPFIAGGLALVVLMLLPYALHSELDTFFFWSTGFNARVYMQPYEGRIAATMLQWFWEQPWAAFALVLALIVAIGRPLVRAPRFSEASFEILTGLMAVSLLFAAVYPLRLWPHYFVPVWPWFGMVLGVVIESTLRKGDEVPVVPQVAVVFLIGSLFLGAGIRRYVQFVEQRETHGWYRNMRPDPACAEIDRLGGPGRESVFMWGTLGDLYVTCQRASASYFTYTTTVAGIVPPFWDEPSPSRAAPGAAEKLLAELEASPPKVVMDYPIHVPGSATMVNMPLYERFLRAHYCRVSTVRDGKGRDITFYARNELESCKTAPTW